MKKVVIASVAGGSGQTTTTVNLAAAAAQRQRVLVLDADPRGSVRAVLRLLGPPSAADAATTGAIWRAVRPGLDVATPYSLQRHDARLLEDLFNEWSDNGDALKDYGLVVIHAPEPGSHAFAAAVRAADELILVARPEPMSEALLPDVLAEIQKETTSLVARLAAVVINHPTSTSETRTTSLHALPSDVPVFRVPFEQSQLEAELTGQVLVDLAPQSAASEAFKTVAERLGLAGKPVAPSGPVAPLGRTSPAVQQPTATAASPSPKSAGPPSPWLQFLLMLVCAAAGFALFWLVIRLR